MPEITVTRTSDDDPMRFDVSVEQDRTSTEHHVSLPTADLKRLGSGRTPEEFIRACFEFLLERESNESILTSFEVGVIGRYFPEFERMIVAR